MTSAFMRVPRPEDQVIVLRRFRHPAEALEYPPGARQWLAGCTHWCWIAPSSRELLRQNPDWMTWCRECAERDLAGRERVLHPTQKEELIAAGMSETELKAQMAMNRLVDARREDLDE